MKKIILNLSVFIVITGAVTNANAQSYQPFPTGDATWEVLRCFYFYPPGWYDKYTFTMDGSDTLYNGQVFKNIYVTNHHLPGTEHDSIYPTEFFGGLRESNKQIFIYQKWASTDTTVQLVYDFNNTLIGDTIFTNVLSGNPYLFGHLVTDTDSVMVGNQFHKRLHLQDVYSSYNTEYWIEGIGSSWGLPFATFWSITDNSYDLSCFYAGQQLKYTNPSPTFGFCQAPVPTITCDSITTSAYELNPKDILFSLYPNPAADVVNLEINTSFHSGLVLNIYNTTGSLVRTERIRQDQQELNISDLGNGLYFFVLQSKDKIESKKLIIQR